MTTTRRTVLRAFTAAGLLAAARPGLGFAAAPTDRRLVVLLLRGGLDGLAAVPPHGDRDHEVRGDVAVAEALDLDGRFGLHPSMAALLPLWEARQLGIVHAVGNPYLGRSHFDAQNCLENGTDRPYGLPTGWLNRALGALGGGEPALAVGRTVPWVLRGAAPVTSADPLRAWKPDDDFLADVSRMYEGDALLGPALAAAVATQELFEPHRARARGRASGRIGDLQRTAEVIGGVLRAADGPRVAVLEAGGWDTHTGQEGTLNRMLGALSDGIVALRDGLGPTWEDSVVLVLTEFGRTVRANGTGGTDHGTASVALLAGGAVTGGVHGRWPGLRDLHDDRDLKPTTDLRSVLKGVLAGHLGIGDAALEDRVFPDSRLARPLEGLV